MNTTHLPFRRFVIRQEGATAVEFALIMMVLVPLLLGTFEMGRALHTRNALDYLADRAARSLMVEHRERMENLRDGGSLSGLEALLLSAAQERTVGINPEALTLSLTRTDNSLELRLHSDLRLLIPFVPLSELLLSASRTVPLPNAD